VDYKMEFQITFGDYVEAYDHVKKS
jgi:hypothetical protein